MNLSFKEETNKDLGIAHSNMNLDEELSPDFHNDFVLPRKSGFFLLLTGSPGSGKSHLLTSIMSAKKKKNKIQSYRKLFDNIIVCSPTLGQGSSNKKCPFRDIKNKHTDLTLEVLNKIQKTASDGKENDEHTIMIFDDIGASLRKNAGVEKELAKMLNNRRHMNLSVIIVLQRFFDCNPSMRSSISHFITFRPKTMTEIEKIGSELMPFKKQDYLQIFNYVFDTDKYAFLYVDMTMIHSNKFEFYNKFNKLTITDSTNNISV
tara:strand:- start:1401 stop:2186 length:786 start_codon:yes stop_codon:yes gene_type:complete